MKKLFLLAALVALLHSCSTQDVKVEVYNPADFARVNEMVEVDYPAIAERLSLAEGAQVVVLDATGEQVPYQITYDGKLIFQTTIEPGSRMEYTVKAGEPDSFAVKAVGDYYPERVDDIAWENDCIAFRTYGPALQATGEKAYGYDVWVKSVDYPVVETRYDDELNPETVAEINRLKETNPDSAQALYNSVSYHIDHGNGLDYYKVGPTLGAGTSALLDADGKIVYPYCYAKYEILDNGPLRFSVHLTFGSAKVGQEDVVEKRVITLDKGTHLNRCEVTYEGLSRPRGVAAGIVVHKASPDSYVLDKKKAYVAYADPMNHPEAMNGQTYIACLFPEGLESVKYVPMAQETAGGIGHVAGFCDYEPGRPFVYYFGSAWSKYDVPDFSVWKTLLGRYLHRLEVPLNVSVRE